STASSLGAAPKKWKIARGRARPPPAGTAGPRPASSDLLQRRVVEHQAPLGAVVREADGDDAAALDPRDDALAERAVADGVAGRECRQVGARRNDCRRNALPRRRPQPLPFDA